MLTVQNNGVLTDAIVFFALPFLQLQMKLNADIIGAMEQV